MSEPLPERWLRGPLKDVPPLLQPAAHALLQAADEIKEVVRDFPDGLLWERPAGIASAGFHLVHMAGVIDRMCTYAQEELLSDGQFSYLQQESQPQSYTATELVNKVEAAVQAMIEQLKATDETTLTQVRAVGRKALPSTVIGLLFHAAEHTMRHLGQLLVTVKVVKEGITSNNKEE